MLSALNTRKCAQKQNILTCINCKKANDNGYNLHTNHIVTNDRCTFKMDINVYSRHLFSSNQITNKVKFQMYTEYLRWKI